MRPRTFVFFGDSVTQANRHRPEVGALGEGYVRIIADELADVPAAPDVINLGIGGNRVRDLRARWGEVVAARPDVLTILVGINDVWRHSDRDDYTPTDVFADDFRSILDGAAASGGEVVLMEPFLLPVADGQQAWLPELREKIDVVNELGVAYGAPVVPLHQLLNEAASELGASELAPDGVHPSPLGHRLIAEAWLAEASAGFGGRRTG
ncbi:SGNH/GDSL hydrolase family protein [Leifsonia sp. NPDC058194]|uniref:SGNH/GDSL hydrolase family protein n=1 Tax=Leifsonia sp. NPDC058194 TaxID=3346374 RepID=UPI0036DAAFA3